MGSCCGKQSSVSMKPLSGKTKKISTGSLLNSMGPSRRDTLLSPPQEEAMTGKFDESSFHVIHSHPTLKLDPKMFRGEGKVSHTERYEKMGMIGKGSFGEVCKVKDRITGKTCVMKTILKSKCQKSELVNDEIEILKQLDHPHIARFYEYYQDELYYYLIMEYCPGGDLLSFLTKYKSIRERDAANFLRQLLSALDYCHRNHIVHRDIKPENIVLEKPGITSALKVIDFGRSKILKPQAKLLEFAGSLFYLAPEVAANEEYDEKCDVWSAGVILYLLICGKPPFYGANKEETLSLIKKGTVTFYGPAWKRVSSDIKNLLLKMLAKSPENRITASQARVHPWVINAFKKPEDISSSLALPLENLRSFYTQHTLQKAVLTFIASQLMDHDQEQPLRKLFSAFDTDDDGQISKDELVLGYKSLNMYEDAAEKEAKEVIRHVDLNINGTIDYNEFLVANLKRQQISSERNLKEAFRFFDQKQKGYIDIEDLRRIFGGICSEEKLFTIVDDVDMNHDGKISFEEFKEMMNKHLLSSKSLHMYGEQILNLK
eukprot:TRINITY_DN3411_c0_g1_i1.p1 TRINITY_DN3411_c0_g1~~TRINITY_DN3411_c0_g1_i1.p1  ORF type:complete len:545 (-),score=58.97 TRINITY_DN3411_c0_g1_i1:101-1735(-)